MSYSGHNVLQLLCILFDTPLTTYGYNSGFFPSINLWVPIKFLLDFLIMMKLIT